MTLVISFLLFPKGFSWFYVVGAILVLGGLLLSSLFKIKQKKDSQMMQPLLESPKHELQLDEMESNNAAKAQVENGTS